MTTSKNAKTLAGVKATPELLSLLAECIASSSTVTDDNSPSRDVIHDSSKAAAMAPLSIYEAKSLLKSSSDDKVIPLQVIRAMYSVMDKDSCQQLDEALAQTQLTYRVPPAPEKEIDKQKKFHKRMERLRLRAEEVRYKKLTDNIDTSVQDDVTTKSMTYAASVGLNMIVAPISFGVFMYFFAGAIFGWMVGDDGRELQPHQTDIKSVIAGVVSGVAMLFIEMILFVIRTHEFEEGMRKKNRKATVSPFGPSAIRVKPEQPKESKEAKELTKS